MNFLAPEYLSITFFFIDSLQLSFFLSTVENHGTFFPEVGLAEVSSNDFFKTRLKFQFILTAVFLRIFKVLLI